MKKVPNILTALRLFMVPLFWWAYFENHTWGGAVFIAACVTDVVDGFIARKFDAITKVGMLLDPLADKLMQISAVTCLFLSGIIPQWIVTVLIMKELIMIISASFLYKKDVVIPANKVGKAATVLLSTMVVYFMFFNDISPKTSEIISVILGIMAFFVLVSYLLLTIKNLVKKSETKTL